MIEKQYGKMKKILPWTFLLTYKRPGIWKKKKKSVVPDENLFVSTNKMSRKVMVSAVISWYDAAKPFFVNENGIKINKENYCKHLKNSCFLQLKTC